MKTARPGSPILWASILLLAALLPGPGAGDTACAARITGQEGVRSISGAGPGPHARPSPTPGVSPAASPMPAPRKAAYKPADGGVTIDFDNVDINLFIKFISELTGKNFVVDRAVKGKITVISPTRLSVEEAYKVFESVLEVHGYTTVPAGRIIKIVPAAEARAKSIETRLREEAGPTADTVVTQIIPLKYAHPEDLKALLAPLISRSSVMVSYPPTGMLIVTDVLSNIRRLLKIIRSVDVEGIGEEIAVIPLQHASATNVARSLDALFQRTARQSKKGGARPAVRIAADERANALILLASEVDMMRMKKLIALLDREIPRGKGRVRVFYLQHAHAEDLAKVLSSLAARPSRPGRKPAARVISQEVQIVADKATNSLVITADKEDYAVLEEVIRKLDIARRMVYLEALIMEVSVDKEFNLGVEWQAIEGIGSHEGRKGAAFGASRPGDSLFPSVDPGTLWATLPTGFSLGVLGEGITIGGIRFPSVGAVARAFRKDSDVHILSTPQILTTDNEEAEIKVGKNIPFLTRQETSTAGIDYSNYEYRDVGVTLRVIPQINQERFVFLKLNEEVTQVVQEESKLGLPTTLKRSAKTAVVVEDGHTVVIGGLIDETLDEGTYEVPCLGGLPALGWLFKSIARSRNKTNLFIFLTPHIIESQAEASAVYEEKKSKIEKIREGVIKLYGTEPPAR